MAVRLATLLAAAAQEPHVPDPEVGRIVDAVAAQFVAAGGRGFEGWEPKRLKEAARAYHARITPLAMPWRRGADTADTFVRPAAPPRVPNIAHWAWRDGDADWTLALSVAMAAVVQRPEALYLHTGPLAAGATAYTEPQTPAGRAALRCLRAAGAQVVRHAADPAPGGGRHPWAEVLGRGRRVRSKQTFAHLSDVTRLKTILDMGGIYLDRDAFLHRRVDHYRWRHDAVLGLEPSNFERDRVANFGCLMARPNSTFFQLFWDGAGRAAYANTSYLRTWGGWAHDSCRKSYALAMKRPDLVHLEARLLQYPFPGHGAARGGVTRALLDLTRRSEVCHMSGFKWNGGRTHQLRMRPSIFGEVLWPNVLRAAAAEPPLPPELLRCVRWLGDTLVNESYMPEAANAAAQGWR